MKCSHTFLEGFVSSTFLRIYTFLESMRALLRKIVAFSHFSDMDTLREEEGGGGNIHVGTQKEQS